jgi:hypothetical protein
VGIIVMKRRFVLAIPLLGALSVTALAWAAESVVTIPLSPPPKADEAKPKSDKTTVAAVPASEPLSPQAIVDIPPPEFSTQPLFAPGIELDSGAIPTPDIDPALIEGKEVAVKEVEPPPVEAPKPRLEARPQPAPLRMAAPLPPMPQPKPTPPALKEQTAVPIAAASDEPSARPLRRGEMEPIDDYRPKKPSSSVVVDPAALDRALVPAAEKPARTTPIPQPKPAAPKPKAEAKILAKGEMEPVDDVPGPKALITRRGEASTFRCFVRDVMAFYDRTHIRCYNKAKNKLNFFAVDTGQPISASVVSKGLAAMQAGKPATITFAPEADLNPSNCAAANCRRLIDIQN